MTRVHVLLGFGVLCIIVGLIIAWPLLRAGMLYKAVPGYITHVLVIPENATHSRLMVSFDFPTKGKREITMGHQLVNDRLEPISDPVLPHDEAARLSDELIGRSVRVFIEVNRPYDSAFMLSPVRATSDNRALNPEQGAIIVIIGLACSILAQMTRLRRP
jgi:hypothetical protein